VAFATLAVMPAQPATAIAALTVDCSDAKAMVQFYRDAFGGRTDPDLSNLDCKHRRVVVLRQPAEAVECCGHLAREVASAVPGVVEDH
jgi:hypothetical protein